MKRVVITWSDVRAEVCRIADERKIPQGWAFDITSPQYLVGQVLGKMIREVPEWMHLVHADGQELLIFEGEEPKDNTPERGKYNQVRPTAYSMLEELIEMSRRGIAPPHNKQIQREREVLTLLRTTAQNVVRIFDEVTTPQTRNDMIALLRIALKTADNALGVEPEPTNRSGGEKIAPPTFGPIGKGVPTL